MNRTMDDIIKELKKYPERIMFLYRWLGETKYRWEERERLCEYLLENIENLQHHIKVVAYAGESTGDPKGWEYLDYRKDERDGFPKDNSGKSKKEDGEYLRGEDHLAMDIFNMGRNEEDNSLKYIDGLGYILDYQMPIGGTPTLLLVKDDSIYDKNSEDYIYGIPDPDKQYKETKKEELFNPGKCDLVAFDEGHFIIYELKKQNNQESMLRAVMEAYTYRQMLNTELATKSFRSHYRYLIPEGDMRWEARLLLGKGKMQYNEYVKKEDSYLRQLMNKLEITPIWYTTDFSIS